MWGGLFARLEETETSCSMNDAITKRTPRKRTLKYPLSDGQINERTAALNFATTIVVEEVHDLSDGSNIRFALTDT